MDFQPSKWAKRWKKPICDQTLPNILVENDLKSKYIYLMDPGEKRAPQLLKWKKSNPKTKKQGLMQRWMTMILLVTQCQFHFAPGSRCHFDPETHLYEIFMKCFWNVCLFWTWLSSWQHQGVLIFELDNFQCGFYSLQREPGHCWRRRLIRHLTVAQTTGTNQLGCCSVICFFSHGLAIFSHDKMGSHLTWLK